MMKIALFGVPGFKLGRYPVSDPRLDRAHEMVEAARKTPAQVELVGPDQLLTADAVLTTRAGATDLLLQDLELVETRLARAPQPEERAALAKIRAVLEAEKFLSADGLSPADLAAVAAHNFITLRPVTVTEEETLREAPDAVIREAFRAGGYICFLTVGGKENRAWPIRHGTVARAAAGTIHTDLQRGFIRAEVIGFEDFVAAGGETQAKRAGKMRLETADYVMQDYDLVNFRFAK